MISWHDYQRLETLPIPRIPSCPYLRQVLNVHSHAILYLAYSNINITFVYCTIVLLFLQVCWFAKMESLWEGLESLGCRRRATWRRLTSKLRRTFCFWRVHHANTKFQLAYKEGSFETILDSINANRNQKSIMINKFHTVLVRCVLGSWFSVLAMTRSPYFI